MNKPPAFQFYADDFLGGTAKFSDSEVGLYARLLCAQWNEGGLPNDNHELSSYGKGGTPIDRVKVKFKLCDDGMLRNERLEIEREKQRKYRESRSLNGKMGGRPMKPQGKHMVSQHKAQKSSPVSSLQSPSSDAEREPHLPEVIGRPTLTEIKAWASMHGLASWKAEDWFHEMEGCGWLDHQGRAIQSWISVLTRVRTKWETDGRPKSPPVSRNSEKVKSSKPIAP